MNKRSIFLLAIAFLCFVLIAAGVLVNNTYEIDRWVLSSGGGQASGETVTLDATLGQPIVSASSGGSIILKAGFWAGGGEVTYNVYLPQVSK
jgi:hypothetical protein